MSINEKLLQRIEWGAAILIPTLCAVLHLVFVFHPGGLWRDEANTARLAQTPAYSDLWTNLRSDPTLTLVSCWLEETVSSK